jgi:hypothetical protein
LWDFSGRIPWFSENLKIMMKALVSLTPDSLILLIPQLEEWVLQNATPTRVGRKGHEIVDLDPWCPDRRYGPHTVALEYGSWEGVRVHGGGFGSIKGLYQAPKKVDAGQRGKATKSQSESQEEHWEAFRVCPVLKKLERSSDEWWFSFFLDEAPRWWIVVDYRWRRIWGNFREPQMCVWSDIWNLKSWKITSHTFRQWFSSVDDSDDDSDDSDDECVDISDSEDESDDDSVDVSDCDHS